MEIGKTIRIGSGKNKSEMALSANFASALTAKGIPCNTEYYDTSENENNHHEVLFEAIRNNEIDTAAFELSSLPLYDPGRDIVVTAISERYNVGEGLLISPNGFDQASDLKLKSGSLVMVYDVRQGNQLLALHPSLRLMYSDIAIDEKITTFTNGECDALLLSKNEYEILVDNKSAYFYLPLHPKEMIPRPGHGITAYVAHKDDIKTRKILKNIHHADVVTVCNVERKVMQLAKPASYHSIGVYCYTDQKGYFHVDAVSCDEFKKITLSQNISSDLADKIYVSLLKP